jgi:hypothetical protein
MNVPLILSIVKANLRVKKVEALSKNPSKWLIMCFAHEKK